MIRFACHAALAGLLLALAACGSGGGRATANLLNQRLHARLDQDIAQNRVALTPLRDGAQVTFLDPSTVPGGPIPSEPGEGSPRAGMIEAMLDPALMRVNIADSSAAPQYLKDQRIGSMTGYFQAMALGSTVHPEDASAPAAAGPAGLAVTLRVVCPHRRGGTGYGSGERNPRCF